MGDPIRRIEDYRQTTMRGGRLWHLVEEEPSGEPQASPGPKDKRLSLMLLIFSVLFFLLTLISLSIFGNDKYYTVKNGESAFTVATKFNVPLNILLKLNDLSHPSSMREGMRIKIPTIHDIHVVKPGDTLHSIARLYGVKRFDLVRYNRLDDFSKLKAGGRIFIPRILSDIRVSTDKKTGLVPFTVRFNIDTNTRDRIRSYTWDLGDGTVSTNRSPTYEFDEKGTYAVHLTVVDENGSRVRSNTIPIVARSLAHIGFGARTHVTLNKDDIFSLETKVIDNLKNTIDFRYKTRIHQDPPLVRQIDDTDRFEITGTGYSKVTFEVKGYEHTSYFFVSPIPTKNVPAPDVEWYRTQFRTGLNGNCGPACVAMGIHWGTGIDIGVRNVRSQIGMPNQDGAIGFNHMLGIFRKYKVDVRLQTLRSAADIRGIIDRGDIAIILIHSGDIKRAKGNIRKRIYDRYYNDSVGHYVIVKGYSLDGEYFVVYDPIPGDWATNSIRYADGVSMIGKNRYYATREVYGALKTPTVLVISQADK